MADDFDIEPVATNRSRVKMKVLAVILGIICWYMIREETSYEQTIRSVGIEIALPSGWQIAKQSAETADVLFRGSRSDLRELTREDVRIEVAPPKPAAGTNFTLRLTAKQVHSPAGVRALRVVPSTITVRLDSLRPPAPPAP